MKVAVFALVLCCVIYATAETNVNQCSGGPSGGYKQSIKIGKCDNPPCRLKKGNAVEAVFKFTPDRNVAKITTTVNARILGLPFPFVGVDGTDGCTQIFESNGETPAGCPLEAGKEYVYKNQFDILDLYPRIKLVVHWGLTGDDGQDVMCFEVPARIVS